MKFSTTFKCWTALSLMASIGATDLSAQSAIYACGHMRRNRSEAIDNLRSSGYTTAILFNVNVESDGTLTTDYDWGNQRPAEAGGIICRDGKYVFGQYQPEYVSDIRTLLQPPTSISRIEICIGGWGNGSYGNIARIIKAEGTGEESTLYKNFKALKETLPEIVAVNNDQEQDYDVESAIAFHRMLAKIGFKTTVAPYMNRPYWQQLVAALNEEPGTCEIVYLQTYGGGSGNNPNDWKVFGDIPLHIGFDCEASSDLAAMENNFRYWRDNCATDGGFLWNYNNESRNLNEWATAINRIYPTRSAEIPAATFYSERDFGGYEVSLPEGEFTMAEMALYGIKARDVASVKVADGYKVTIFLKDNFEGSKKELTEPAYATLPRGYANYMTSVKVERQSADAIEAIEAGRQASISLSPDGNAVMVEGSAGLPVEVYDASGRRVANAIVGADGKLSVDMSGHSAGVYAVSAGSQNLKILINH